MGIQPGFRSAAPDEGLLEDYDGKRWGCYSCTKPSVVIYSPFDKSRPQVFKCKVNQYAPFANSIRCPSYEMVPGIDELWT